MCVILMNILRSPSSLKTTRNVKIGAFGRREKWHIEKRFTHLFKKHKNIKNMEISERYLALAPITSNYWFGNFKPECRPSKVASSKSGVSLASCDLHQKVVRPGVGCKEFRLGCVKRKITNIHCLHDTQ